MPWEKYAFCAFIFVLVCLCMVLFRYLFGGRLKGKDDAIGEARDKALYEERMRGMADRAERAMSTLEDMLDKQNKRFGQVLFDFAKNLDTMEDIIKHMEAPKDEAADSRPSLSTAAAANEHVDKSDMVRAMARRGVSHEQIAKRLSIPVGEVSLIIGLRDERP